MDYISPWGHKESDMTEKDFHLQRSIHLYLT